MLRRSFYVKLHISLKFKTWMQSNTIQSNPIKILRSKSYLNPNLKNQKAETNRWRMQIWWSVSLFLYIHLFVSQYLLDLSSYLILTSGSSLYLVSPFHQTVSTNRLPLWSRFWTMKKGFGHGVCCGMERWNREGEGEREK